MSMLHDLASDDVKEPIFDLPQSAGPAPSGISDGTRVVLSYHGRQLAAQVTAVERLGTAFVGRVLRFAEPDAAGELAPGDLVRFRPRNVIRTD